MSIKAQEKQKHLMLHGTAILTGWNDAKMDAAFCFACKNFCGAEQHT